MISFDNTEIAFKYKSSQELKKAKVLFKTIASPTFVKMGKSLTKFAIKCKLPISWAIKPTLYRHFVGGESLNECAPTVEMLGRYNVKSILDYSVEATEKREDMQKTLNEVLKSILFTDKKDNIPFAVFKPTAFASIKTLTQATENKNPDAETLDNINWFKETVDKLCKTAFEYNVPILIDAEDSWYQPFLDELIEEMMQKYNKERAIVYNTLQMYRKDRLDFLKQGLQKAEQGGYFFGAKFVRGAYMEHERERAKEKGYPSPIHETKEDTDNAYNAALEFSIDHIDKIQVFSGSHNEQSNHLLVELIKKKGLANDDKRIWISQLYGMSDHISFNLAAEGYNVTKYTPYGPVKNILPYLIRRAEENTSIAGQTGRELSLINKELKRRKAK